MHIFLVEYNEDDDVASNPVGAFSSMEKAKAFMSKLEAKFPDNEYFVSSWTLDDEEMPTE